MILVPRMSTLGPHFKRCIMEALKLQNVSKYYASQTAVVMGLSNISLTFSTGEFVAVTGENGSGKSTLANVIGGMLPYEGGELYVMGQPTSHYNAADWERYRRDLIGFISQDYGILPGNTVFENVESALVLTGFDRESAKERTREILKQVELSGFSRRRAAKLSSGQKQRLAIARALAKPSKILIADEPTGNLDRENSDKVIKLLKEASKDRLVILITHEFSEAQDHITRHIVLSDGKVVQDTECTPEGAAPETEEAPAKPELDRGKAERSGKLAAYVARLTAKARPVFFLLTTLILVLTAVASFIFIGNFIAATDDVPSRLYDNKAFRNGDPKRIVLAREDEKAFNDEDIAKIAEQQYVASVEEYGYICDVNYHYREDVDYRKYTSADYAEDYDPLGNPDAFTLTVKIELLDSSPKYLRSVTQAGELTAGRMAEGYYEVLSSDPNVKAGTRIDVYIRDRAHWAISQYLSITFDVVGETTGERGLYFSDSFCRMMNDAVMESILSEGGSTWHTGGDLGRYPLAPFDAERFKDRLEPFCLNEDTAKFDEDKIIGTLDSLEENECMYPIDSSSYGLERGQTLSLSIGTWWWSDNETVNELPVEEVTLTIAERFESKHTKFVLVSPEMYDRLTGKLRTDQVSVFINDYAYTERAIKALQDMGYVALSPFTQGSTTKDAARETERLNLLRISLAAALLTLVLQLVLLKVAFSSLKDHYRLLSNMGLREKTARRSLALLFLFMTIIAELIAAAAILLLNKYGYARVVNIFKYIEPPKLILIFAVHFVFCAAAYFIAARTIKKQVFSINGFYEDIDGELMEEVMSE